MRKEPSGRCRMTFGRQLRYVWAWPLIFVCYSVAAFVFDERNRVIDYTREIVTSPLLIILFLPIAYFFYVLPAFVIGHVDELLFRRKMAFFYRLLLCNCLGILIACGPAFWFYPNWTIQHRVEGGLPALIATSICCAWTNRAFSE